MLPQSFVRHTLWAGAAALMALASPVLAMADAAHPAEICVNSSNSMQQLAMIDKPGDDGFQCLGLMLDGDAVKALRLETHRFQSERRHADSERIEVTEFPLAVVKSSRGAVLDGIPGHDAIILQGNLSPSSSKAE